MEVKVFVLVFKCEFYFTWDASTNLCMHAQDPAFLDPSTQVFVGMQKQACTSILVCNCKACTAQSVCSTNNILLYASELYA